MDLQNVNDVVCSAIRSKHIVHFYYDGFTRIVQPHLLGIMRNGSVVLSAFQVAGESRTGRSRGWKNFVTNKIEEIEIENDNFTQTANGYNRDDSRMRRILCRI